MRNQLVGILLFIPFGLFSQVSPPQFPSMQPVSPNRSYNPSAAENKANDPIPSFDTTANVHPYRPYRPKSQSVNTPAAVANHKHGFTAQDVINSAKANARQTMLYGTTMPDKQEQIQQLHKILAEEKEAQYSSDPKLNAIKYYNSPVFAAKTRQYTLTFNTLSDMLNGKIPLSVSSAYYLIEYAHGNVYLSYKKFMQTIRKGDRFIRQWMKQQHLNSKDNETLNYAIQRFMADTLTLTIKQPDAAAPPKKITHLPFHYDYIDFKGHKDYRNYYVTKCIATGFGQCNSLPAAYLCYAEGLGAKAYLSFAPHHALIKYPDNKGHLHNYEATTNWYISDTWYEETMYIKPQAVRSGIYLDTLNSRQIVANCMVDLAIDYMFRFGAANGKFIVRCLQTAAKAFPQHNNIEASLAYSSFLARMLGRELYYDHAKDLSDTLHNSRARYYYDRLKKNEQFITALGYQLLPKKTYDDMMLLEKQRGQLQTQKGINGKQKRSLFIIKK